MYSRFCKMFFLSWKKKVKISQKYCLKVTHVSQVWKFYPIPTRCGSRFRDKAICVMNQCSKTSPHRSAPRARRVRDPQCCKKARVFSFDCERDKGTDKYFTIFHFVSLSTRKIGYWSVASFHSVSTRSWNLKIIDIPHVSILYVMRTLRLPVPRCNFLLNCDDKSKKSNFCVQIN